MSAEPKTAFYATLKRDGQLVDGMGEQIGVAFPSSSEPGSMMVCISVEHLHAIYPPVPAATPEETP